MTQPVPRGEAGLLVSGVLALALVASGCTGPAAPGPRSSPTPPAVGPTIPTATTDPEHRLRLALDREPVSLDPLHVQDDAGRIVVDAVHDSLTALSPNLVVAEPAAAADWTASADLRTWTCRLRPDTTWHDGEPVVANDFVRAFRRIASAEGVVFNRWVVEPLLDDAGAIDVEAPDDATVVIRTPRPLADLPVLVSDPALAPRRPGGPDRQEPVGNGPFRFVEPWAHNQYVRLAPAPGHWDVAGVDEVLLPIYAQRRADQVQYADFRAGALDVAAVPVDEVEAAGLALGRSETGYHGPGVLDGERATLHYLGFRTDRAPWDDPRLRRALSLLLDRDALVAQVGDEARSPARGIVPPGFPGAGLATCDHCQQDPAWAEALVDQAATLPERPVRLLTPDDPASARVASAVARSLGEGLAVPVEVDRRALADYAAALQRGDLDLFLAAATASRPSMGGVLEPLLGSGSSPLDNPGRVSLPAVDRALARAEATLSPTARLAAWREAEQAALDEAVIAPLYLPRLRMVVADDVVDFRMTPGGRIDLAVVDVAPEE